MKKLILCIIPLILLAMVFTVMPASAESESATSLVSFNDGVNLSVTHGTIVGINTSVTTDGGGALHINDGGGNPGMILFYNFSAKNLSSYDAFYIDLYTPVGSNWGHLGVNFTTDAGGNEGLNYYAPIIGNTAGGWCTVKMDKSEFANGVNGATWDSITRVRIVWYDSGNNSGMTHILFDNLRGVKRSVSGTVAPTSISNGVGTISNCEAMDGWTDGIFNTEVGKSANVKRSGSHSVVMKSKIPVGQNDQIGAMTRLNFTSAVNFSNACRFTFYMLFDQVPPKNSQMQFNFVTSGSDDGFNLVYSFNGTSYAANTWHAFTVYANAIGGINGANWSSIKTIRITWFNRDQSNVPLRIFIDDITASGHTSVNGGTSSVHTRCSTCNKTLSSSHSYTKTTQTAATCTTKGTSKYTCGCGYSYTSQDIAINSSNHTGSSTYGGTSGVHTKYSCCGATISTSHSYTVDSGVQYSAATCIAKRKNYKKCACGYNPQSSSYLVETGSVNSSNHAGSSTYGGTSGVHTKYSCCGVTISSSHSYTVDSGVQYSAATCIAKRKNYKQCACGYNPKSTSYLVETGSVNASNHAGSSTYGGTSGVHTKYSCCGATISTSHSITVDTGVQYSAATCTAKRKNYAKCACGYDPRSSSYTVETGSALGHSAGSTWSSDGTNHWNLCTRCSTKMNTAAHTASSTYSSNGTKHWKDCTVCGYDTNSANCSGGTATCTAAATCSTCNNAYGSVNSSNHNKASSYSTDGTNHWKECTRCGADLDKAAHTASSSYSSDGTNHWKDCTVCGYDTNKAAHTASSSYSSDGTNHWKDCTACGYDTNKAAHGWDSGKVTTAATCVATGVRTYTCGTCSKTKTETIAIDSSNHSYGTASYTWTGYTKCEAKRTCQRSGCGNVQSESGTITNEVTKVATCTATGTRTYTAKFTNTAFATQTNTETLSIDPANHTGKVVFVGSEAIHSKYDCCNATVSTEHSYTTSVEIAATCTEMGTTRYTCECGYTYTAKDIAIDPANHTGDIVNGGTLDVHTKYDCCDAVVSTVHTYTTSVEIAATCVEMGTTRYTCECGYTYTAKDIAIDPNNHVGGTEVRGDYAEDCGNDGYTGDIWCLDCETIIEEGQVIPATGAHTGGEATCISKAVCDVCSQEYGGLNANNHKHTEIRDASIVYSGNTWCNDCGTLVKEGVIIAYYGDANNDGNVSIDDAMLVAQYVIGLPINVEINTILADVDGDGMLTSIDAMLITQFDVELFEKFPVEL